MNTLHITPTTNQACQNNLGSLTLPVIQLEVNQRLLHFSRLCNKTIEACCSLDSGSAWPFCGPRICEASSYSLVQVCLTEYAGIKFIAIFTLFFFSSLQMRPVSPGEHLSLCHVALEKVFVTSGRTRNLLKVSMQLQNLEDLKIRICRLVVTSEAIV